jgi:hypothetical protein
MEAKDQLLAQYDLHNTLFNNVIADINDDEADVRLAPGISNVKWLAGHLVWGQRGLARMGNVPMDIEWIGHFDSQADKKPGTEVKVPSMEEIKQAWNHLAPLVRKGLEGLSADALNEPFEFPLPAFRTQEGFWAFINHHQAYTIGQIGILRRALGKDAMKYF